MKNLTKVYNAAEEFTVNEITNVDRVPVIASRSLDLLNISGGKNHQTFVVSGPYFPFCYYQNILEPCEYY